MTAVSCSAGSDGMGPWTVVRHRRQVQKEEYVSSDCSVGERRLLQPHVLVLPSRGSHGQRGRLPEELAWLSSSSHFPWCLLADRLAPGDGHFRDESRLPF